MLASAWLVGSNLCGNWMMLLGRSAYVGLPVVAALNVLAALLTLLVRWALGSTTEQRLEQ